MLDIVISFYSSILNVYTNAAFGGTSEAKFTVGLLSALFAMLHLLPLIGVGYLANLWANHVPTKRRPAKRRPAKRSRR